MIELCNVSKIYNEKKANEFTALNNVSLKINDGEFVAIIGKSGAGKSTLMNIIGCIDDFEKGTYLLDDANVNEMSNVKKAKLRNKKLGIVLQDFALIEEYTVEENISVPLYFDKHSGKRKEMVEAAMKLIGIENLKGKAINKLSGGQKQRVAIARAVVNNPDIILADEPTGALDTKTSKEIIEVFKSLNNMGKTVIVITHDMEIANQAKRIVEISDGKICG